MKNKIDLKEYISKNVFYNEKLLVNKNTSIDQIFLKYKNLYSKNWSELPLKINEKYNIHINYEILKPIINKFMSISSKVETKKNNQEKFNSSLKHEIYNNLLIEGYVSSRKMILDVVNKKMNNDQDKMVNNVYNAMIYILQGRNINKDNLLYLYKTLTNDIDMDKESLDGTFYRLDHVSISNRDKGIDPLLIEQYVDDLLRYLNNDNDISEEKKIIKAIAAHFYFEFIHPYYDFNGRTGRLLVLWYSYNYDIYHNLAFFSQSIAAYRDQYLKIFKQTRFNESIDITYFVAQILYILIKQKEQYFVLTKFEKYVANKYQKQLSSIQKEIIMFDQALRDIYQLDYYSAVSMSKVIEQYKEYSIQFIYREIKKLEEFQILKRINKRDSGYYIEYKLIDKY